MNVVKTYREQCPKCGELIDVTDCDTVAYIKFCEHCGYESDVDYYQDPKTKEVIKMTKTEAISIGAWFECPICKAEMTPKEKTDYGKCIFCQSESGGEIVD